MLKFYLSNFLKNKFYVLKLLMVSFMMKELVEKNVFKSTKEILHIQLRKILNGKEVHYDKKY